MEKLFGTDGVRGKANQHPITCDMAMKIGRAAARYFSNSRNRTKIVISKDTRISGDMLECAVAAGICSAGADALLTGVLPTPGLALITRMAEADAGIVISASHNPFEDNGIKIFNGHGLKLNDSVEDEIEKLVLDDGGPRLSVGRTIFVSDGPQAYVSFLKSCMSGEKPLDGMKIVLDCSNGAAHAVAPVVFEELGAIVTSLFIEPNGVNINVGCGSQNPEALQKEVLKQGAALGFAFDGDGDRVIAVDDKGSVISGDRIIAVCAKHLKETGRLAENTVVTTVMSNLGLKQALARMDIKHIITDVGDRYVLEGMHSSGAILGGEDSGHLLFLSRHTTGDGIMSAIQLCEAVLHFGKPLSGLAEIMEVFPQVLINVPVSSKPDLEGIAPIAEAIRNVEESLADKGRVLVRYSGTRPACRVMVEGPDQETTRNAAQQIADVVKAELGSES